jgi:hypothetical protein
MKNEQRDFHPLDQSQKFEALRMLHDTQAELLRFMSMFDFKIFGGYITLQLLLGGWLSEHMPTSKVTRNGIGIIDLALAAVTTVLIVKAYLRRTEIAGIFKNINDAFLFTEIGAYLPNSTIIPEETTFRPWCASYITGIVVALAGIGLILFGGYK